MKATKSKDKAYRMDIKVNYRISFMNIILILAEKEYSQSIRINRKREAIAAVRTKLEMYGRYWEDHYQESMFAIKETALANLDLYTEMFSKDFADFDIDEVKKELNS